MGYSYDYPMAPSSIGNTLLTFDRIITNDGSNNNFTTILYTLRIDLNGNVIVYAKHNYYSSSNTISTVNMTNEKPGIYEYRLSYRIVRK